MTYKKAYAKAVLVAVGIVIVIILPPPGGSAPGGLFPLMRDVALPFLIFGVAVYAAIGLIDQFGTSRMRSFVEKHF